MWIVDAFKTSVQGGLSPETFWKLTPYLTLKAISGLSNGRISLAWHIAALQRQKKLKTVDTYFSKEKTAPPNNVANKMRTMFKAHNNQVK